MLSKNILSNGNVYISVFITSILVLILTIYPTYGFNRKSHSAIIGSLISILICFPLTYLFIDFGSLTGFASEESGFLKMLNSDLNMKDILFAGIVIGTLGVLDDITISQSSIVEQLKKANKYLPDKEIYNLAMSAGRDHASSMINTLIIAYAGAAFPLFLLLTNESGNLVDTINMEVISEEVVRMVIGSIVVILAIPISTYISSKIIRK